MPKLLCEGWWEQAGYGRQSMNGLVMDFADGGLTGNGEDVIGPFVMIGRMDGEQIHIHKQYLGQHSIDYDGTTSGEGVYFGYWSSLGEVGGKWSIKVHAVADGEVTEITPIVPSSDD